MIPIHRQIPAWTLCLRGPEAGLSIRHSKIEPHDLLSPQITSYREANYVKVSRDALLEAELFSDPTCSPRPPTSRQDTARVRAGRERACCVPAPGLAELPLRRLRVYLRTQVLSRGRTALLAEPRASPCSGSRSPRTCAEHVWAPGLVSLSP